MFCSLRMTRAPSMRIGAGDPLSKTMIVPAPAIDRTQSRSISPPPVASSTMTSTSLMIHAIESHGAGQTPELDASGSRDVHLNRSVAASGRQKIGIASDLNHRARSGGVLKPRGTGARQKAQRVSRLHDPTPAIRETLHLEFRRIQLAAAMDHMRIFEFDAVAGTPPEHEPERDEDREQPGQSKT